MRALVRLLFALILFAPPAFGQTAALLPVEDIVARHVEARGGAAALLGLKALRREGRIVVPGFNAELLVVDIRQRPGSVRQEVTFQGLQQVQAFDGTDAWQINPFQGRKDPERLSRDSTEAKSLALAADLDTPLINAKAKGVKLTSLGLEDVDGTPAYKIRATLKNGDEATYFVDPDSFMIIRLIEKQSVRGAIKETETDFGEYERVAGVYVPMTEEFGAKGSPSTAKQKLVFEKAEAIDPAAPSAFAFPSGK